MSRTSPHRARSRRSDASAFAAAGRLPGCARSAACLRMPRDALRRAGSAARSRPSWDNSCFDRSFAASWKHNLSKTQSCSCRTACIRSSCRSRVRPASRFFAHRRWTKLRIAIERDPDLKAAGRNPNERSDSADSDRVDVARPPVRRTMEARNRRFARRARARHRRGDHARRQRHRRGRAQCRGGSARGAAGLGGDRLRPARRDSAQGRRAHAGEPGRAGLLDHARDRRHRAEGRLRGADGGEHPAPLRRHVHRAARPDPAQRRRRACRWRGGCRAGSSASSRRSISR